MKQQLSDYNIILNRIPIKYNNTNTINLSKNPVQHSKTKHIKIKHHFLRNHILKKNYILKFINTKNQLTDIFTKPLPKKIFFSIKKKLNLLNIKNLKK